MGLRCAEAGVDRINANQGSDRVISMKIGNLFRDRSAITSREREINDAVARSQRDNVEKTVGKKGEDRITISPLARQLATVNKVLSENDDARSERVAALKEKVANGSYSVSSEDVAKAIISYASDVEPLKEEA